MPFRRGRMPSQPRAWAQMQVEYGLLLGVVAVAFLLGMNALMAGATTYLGHAEPTPNATVLAGLPNHVVAMPISCPPARAPNYTGDPISCSLSVTDTTTVEPGSLPRGTIEFSSVSTSTTTTPPDGTFSPTQCILQGSGVTSRCDFTYTPTNFGDHDISAVYHPTSNHKPRVTTLAAVAHALDRTQMRVTCVKPVPVGEPSQCTAGVYDLYSPRQGFKQGLSLTVWTTSPTGTGTFSDEKRLSPQIEPYRCTTDAALSCGMLLRSGTTLGDEPAHSVVAAFDGDDRYDRANNSPPPESVPMGPPTVHPVSVSVVCDRGATPGSALQMQLGAPTTCTAIVTDVYGVAANYNDPNGNPWTIAPTGEVSWTRSADWNGDGTLSNSGRCALRPIDDQGPARSFCQVRYMPTSIGTPPGPSFVGDHTITATYWGLGDRGHANTTDPASTEVYVTN